ncbi:MAG: hypothetical protein LN413_00115 [Candidatus Thermoplasmatota archaeon]|nr:hypothetical protein [Candidatus Thermoplasmatota archaeon]
MTLIFRLELPGQVPPGKSQQGRRQDGATYPKAKSFAPWVKACQTTNPYPQRMFSGRFLLRVRYTPGDLRPRNVAGMQDAIMHYLEHGGRAPRNKLIREAWKLRRRWIDSDEQIVDVDWRTAPIDRKNPRCVVEIWREGS